MSSETLNDVLTALKTKKIRIVCTEKNRQTRYHLGITVDDQITLVKTLSSTDYVSGPESDYNGTSGNIWKFKKSEFGEVFYIKIKYKDPLTVISCHIDNMDT